jgi:hypothetical protein
VAFAEVEKFLDTPVKRYSSGMYVRLAFAVAAHLEPEILVVDEVLAVGDVAISEEVSGEDGGCGKRGKNGTVCQSYVLRPIIGLEVSFSLFDKHGSLIFYSAISKSPNFIDRDHQPGHYIAEAYIPPDFLAPGIYTLTIGLDQPNIYLFDLRDNVIGFSVVDSGSREYLYAGQEIGSILVNFEWRTKRTQDYVIS